MPLSDKRKYHFYFAGLILALTAIKWGDLHLPYFWDELGVYSRAASYQLHHIISLMPSSLPPDLSRGHPLLFTFLNALALHALGENILSAHIFSLSVSVLLLTVIYFKVSKYFNPKAALLSIVILIAQPLFLAQSELVLPEITLALFVFMAICCYYETNYIGFAFFASLATLTKESAIVLPIAVIGYSVLRWLLLRKRPGGISIAPLLLSITSLLVFGAFLMVQKHENGWFFFPQHINAVKITFAVFSDQFQHFTNYLLQAQGRLLLTILTIAGFVFALLSNKVTQHRIANSFIPLLVITGIGFLGFNSVTDLFMERYVLIVLVLYAICAAAAITAISSNKFFIALAAIILILIGYGNWDDGSFGYDSNLSYRREVHVLQQAINYVEENAKPGEEVIGNFPIGFALNTKTAGYRNNDTPWYHDEGGEHAYYLLLTDPGTDFHPEKDNEEKTLLKTFDNGYAHVKVYFVKRKGL